MLEALVIAGLIAAPLGSAALFLPGRHRYRPGPLAAIGRVIVAVFGAAVLGAAGAGVLDLLHATEGNVVLGGAAVTAAGILWLPATRNWSPRAQLCWASCTYLFAVYLVYAIEWTFASDLGPASTIGGVLLWSLEVIAAAMSCAYLWELCDALGTEHWRRRRPPLPPRHRTPTEVLRAVDVDNAPPLISLHVPAHNEPPAMVIETLRALLRLDYPRVQIVVIDDNTDDESLWRPVESWCRRHNVTFKHLENWPGLQVRRAELRAAAPHRPGRRDHRRRRLRLPGRAGSGCATACRSSPTRGSGSCRRRRTTATGGAPATTGGSTTRTSTSSPSPSPRGTSATARSSPAPWA